MSLQISVMLILLAPCFWPEVEYIALKEQMDSEFHWEMEIGWQPANSSVLEAEWVAALNLPSAVGDGVGREGGRERDHTEQKYASECSSADVYITF